MFIMRYMESIVPKLDHNASHFSNWEKAYTVSTGTYMSLSSSSMDGVSGFFFAPTGLVVLDSLLLVDSVLWKDNKTTISSQVIQVYCKYNSVYKREPRPEEQTL